MRPSVLLFLCCLTSVADTPASLALPDQIAVPGQILVAALSFFSQGQAVAAVQFDMASDPGVSFGVLPGAQIGIGAKVLYTAALPTRGLRVVIIGINQAQIPDGELLCPVILVDPNAALGTAQISVSNVVATGGDGSPVQVSPAVATVQIQAGAAPQSFVAGSVVNAASLLAGPVSPGEIVTILGGPELAGASAVQFNGVPASLLYAGPGQVNAIVPFALDTNSNTNLQILTPQQSLGTVSLATAATSPAAFTLGSGTGPAAVLNQDYSLNSYLNPAHANSVIMVYGTGFGALISPVADGQPSDGPTSTAIPVTATVAGVRSEVTYAGTAPGLVTGLVQINILIPEGLQPDPFAPLGLSVGSAGSAAGVTVAIE